MQCIYIYLLLRERKIYKRRALGLTGGALMVVHAAEWPTDRFELTAEPEHHHHHHCRRLYTLLLFLSLPWRCAATASIAYIYTTVYTAQNIDQRLNLMSCDVLGNRFVLLFSSFCVYTTRTRDTH